MRGECCHRSAEAKPDRRSRGCVGRDAAGEILVKELQAARVNCDQLVYTTEYPTSETVILLVEGEDRRYLHAFGANQAFTVRHIDRDWLAELDVFYLGGLFAMPGIVTDELLTAPSFRSRAKGGHGSRCGSSHQLSGRRRNEKASSVCRLVFAQRCGSGRADRTDETHSEALNVFRSWGAQGLVVTMGEHGAIGLFGNEHWRCNAYPWQTIDPSGAGDAFASGLITGIANGWDFPRSLMYASALGASATQAVGTTDGVLTQAAGRTTHRRTTLTVSREHLTPATARENTLEI